jgi:hypothetical protein
LNLLSSKPLHTWVVRFGTLVSVLLIGWIVWRAVEHASLSVALDWQWDQWRLLAISVVMYTAVIVVAAVISRLLLAGAGNIAGFPKVVAIYLVAQAGKYLPGNVGHHIGRMVLSKRAGVEIPQVLFVMLIENLWALGTATALAVLPLLWLGESFLAQEIELPALPVLVALVLATALAPYGSQRLFHRLSTAYFAKRDMAAPEIELPRVRLALATVVVYAAGYLVMGSVLVLLGLLFGEAQAGNVWLVSGLYAMAWVVGFVTPGAPAGLGVREVILVAGLTPLYGAETATGITIILRIVTLSGDGVAYLLGLLLWKISRTAKPSCMRRA